MTEEHACAMEQLWPVAVAIVWAPAMVQVAIETINKRIVQTRDRHAFLADPINEMFRRPNISADSRPCAPGIAKFLSKAFKGCPQRAVPKCLNAPR